jgi:hypothetical protein
MKPGSARPAIGIYKDQNLKFGWKLRHSSPEVIHLLTAAIGLLRNHYMGLDSRTACNALHGAVRRILGGRQDEKQLIIPVVKFRKCDEVMLEARLHSFAGAQNRGAWRVKSGIGAHAFSHERKPLQSLPDEIHTRRNLQDREEIKERFHVASSITNGRCSQPAKSMGRIAAVNAASFREGTCQAGWIDRW